DGWFILLCVLGEC
ncbi:hypothetical protein CP10743SC13_0441B, partial [Chlamydia psittaci 10_743_SC13]